MKHNKALVLGGAGFLGSHISKSLLEEGYKITIIDGLFEKTGGDYNNLVDIINYIEFIDKDIKKVKKIENIISHSDLIIDSMGWTSHIDGYEDPIYDLKLNQASHLYLIKKLSNSQSKTIIYLSSRSVYGFPKTEVIDESSPLSPVDLQGIHKLAGEYYFNHLAETTNNQVISLRLPNCFGKGQKVKGFDIGLIGYLIKSSLNNEDIKVYSKNRRRNILYAKDFTNILMELIKLVFPSKYIVLNVPGYDLEIYKLANLIISMTNKGSLSFENIPDNIQMIDFNVVFTSKLLHKLINVNLLDLNYSILETINYFKEEM